jgi:hypothetical protein
MGQVGGVARDLPSLPILVRLQENLHPLNSKESLKV